MPKFTVCLRQPYQDDLTVTVDADSREDAMKEAIGQLEQMDRAGVVVFNPVEVTQTFIWED